MPVAGFLSNWATPQVDRGRDIDVPHVSVRSPFSQVAAVSPDPRASYVPDCDAHPHAAAASRLDQEQRLPPLQAVAGWYPGLRAAPCEAIGGDLEISRSVHLTRSEPPRVRWRRWGRDHPPSAQTPRATPQRPPDPPPGVDLGARPAFGLERRVRPSLDAPGPGPTGRADPVTSPRWVCLAWASAPVVWRRVLPHAMASAVPGGSTAPPHDEQRSRLTNVSHATSSAWGRGSML
jgi:hypothetical protein